MLSLLYGAHGCPAPRVRALEAEVEVPVALAEDVEGEQREWWAAKAAALERRGEYLDECEGDGEDADADADADDEEDEFAEREEEGARETVQQTHQMYAALHTARQKALDFEAFARVGQSQRETFRNRYMALGMRYRGVRRARAVEAQAEAFPAASSHSLPSHAPPSSGVDVASASFFAACDDEEEDRNAPPDDAEASSSSSDSGEEDDSDSDAGSDCSSRSISSSPLTPWCRFSGG
ncbi:hypothetical protein C8R47DRAFT_1210478 [Mycena vitilis]|nr:hypothetical protein C8R47DRAFT_1210478 [Mycena vitilis]